MTQSTVKNRGVEFQGVLPSIVQEPNNHKKLLFSIGCAGANMVYFGIFCFVLSFFMLVICTGWLRDFGGWLTLIAAGICLVGIFIVITAGALYPEEF